VSGFRGVGQVLRYNWPAYAGAAAFLALAMIAPRRLRRPLVAAGLTGAWFAAASLIVTNLVYDRSEYARWDWPRRVLLHAPRRVAVLHAGLDNVSANLRGLWPDATIQIVDFFDASTMTEPAIARARAGQRHGDALQDIWPNLDAAFVVLAAHELRTDSDRAAFFLRVAGALAPHGRLVLLEHLRDLPNAAVYGPGAMHFLPRNDYITAFADGRLEILEERAMTPFLRLFVLAPSA
jgi:SAM-dependent methyltransferase